MIVKSYFYDRILLNMAFNWWWFTNALPLVTMMISSSMSLLSGWSQARPSQLNVWVWSSGPVSPCPCCNRADNNCERLSTTLHRGLLSQARQQHIWTVSSVQRQRRHKQSRDIQTCPDLWRDLRIQIAQWEWEHQSGPPRSCFTATHNAMLYNQRWSPMI